MAAEPREWRKGRGRHRAADRTALLTLLEPVDRDYIARLIERFRLSPDGWHCVPALGPIFEQLAWSLEVERLVVAGKTLEAAEQTAAARLGLVTETCRSRAKRWAETSVRRLSKLNSVVPAARR